MDLGFYVMKNDTAFKRIELLVFKIYKILLICICFYWIKEFALGTYEASKKSLAVSCIALMFVLSKELLDTTKLTDK